MGPERGLFHFGGSIAAAWSRHMTRIWLLSDLHQEFVRDPVYGAHPLTSFDPAIAAPPDFDVVVLAGDRRTAGALHHLGC